MECKKKVGEIVPKVRAPQNVIYKNNVSSKFGLENSFYDNQWEDHTLGISPLKCCFTLYYRIKISTLKPRSICSISI
jgi:hypothetical protein